MSLATNDSRHGTANGYNNHKCRCSSCRRAWADYFKEKGYLRTPAVKARRRARYALARAHGYSTLEARRRSFWSDPTSPRQALL